MATRVRKVGDIVGKNALGGIDRVSRRELAGERPQGSTGVMGTSNFRTLGTIPATINQETPIQVPPPPEPSPVPGSIAERNAGLASSTGMTIDTTGSLVPPPKTEKSNFQSLFEQATALEKGVFDEMGTSEERQLKLREEAGLAQKEALYNALSGRLNAINRQSQADVLRTESQMESSGATKALFSAKASRIERDAAIRALPVQAELAAASGDLNSARQYVTDMAAVQSQDALAKYQYKSKLVDSVYQFATAEEQRKLDTIKDKEDKAYDMQKTNLSLKNDWAKTAIEYGQSSLAGQMMGLDPSSETFTNDLAILQGKVQKPVVATKRDTQVVDGQLVDMQTGEVIKNISGLSSYEGEFANVVDSASGLVGAERGKTSRIAIGKALADGDYVSAYALTGNNVEESLTGETKSKFANARTDIAVMSGMRDAIQAYVDAGGDMGFLKGTANDISRKLGQLTSDPKFASLAVQLQREFQSYRQNLTGAAFSPAESADYEAVNPRTNASLELNLATIDGALSQLENRVTSTINTRVPGASALYEKVSGKQTGDVIDPRQAPTGTIVEISGTKYKKVGDNEFQPL